MQKYGQHFLINPHIIAQIADVSQLLRAENLVEIGPGKGALTEALLARGNTNFTLVEIDPQMVAFLQTHFSPKSEFNIVCQNFLTFDLQNLPQVPTEFVSNLPYIDAAAILDKVLSWPFFQTAVFMFQKEQAQKITAQVGDALYGPLSILSQLRATVSLVCNVGRGCFNPPPKVESRVLAFTRKKPPQVEWKKLQRVVKVAFVYRRKTLSNALLLGGYEKEQVFAALTRLQLPSAVRPEQITPAQYVDLANRLP